MELNDHMLLAFLALGQIFIALLIMLFMRTVDKKFLKREIFKDKDEE